MKHLPAILGLLLPLLSALVTCKPPSIVFIISDDQDARLGSLNYMHNVQKSIISEGINSLNHFGTVALCCPARATLLRGQAAHNTNVTSVAGPAGAWPKFLATGEDGDNLAHWLKKAGYTTAYFGKFMNQYGLKNYQRPPSGWDWMDLLVEPWIYAFNHVVMSRNGETPVYYEGWHQSDVIRIKAIKKLERLIGQDNPFYLEIAPSSPHVRIGGWPTVPLSRYMFHFPGATAPRTPNFNPLDDEKHKKKGSWVGELPVLNESVIEVVDRSFRARMQGLQGIDEIVEDVVQTLERDGVLEDTFIIYTTDNGFHLGTHRAPSGKGLPYIEDTNLPLAVRGPGIPRARQLAIPSSHIDMAPTLLDIAGVAREDWPPFFDGRSLLPEWQNLEPDIEEISKEVINVEFWGSSAAPAEKWTQRHQNNTYKALRLVSEKQGWLFTRWCTSNHTEMYNTTADSYELDNLAINPSAESKRVMDRLSGLLLVTKSCGEGSCRRPWEVLRSSCGPDAHFKNLDEAMDARYDEFFASLPRFGFQECLKIQRVENEGPYFPPESVELGRRYRGEEDGTIDAETWVPISTEDEESEKYFGDVSQRYAGFEDLMKSARVLAEEEMSSTVKCTAPDYCEELWED